MRLGIDARFYGPEGTGIGRTLVKLLDNLQKIDTTTQYVVFLKRSNFDQFQPVSANFQKVLVDVPWYSAREQLLLPVIFGKEKLDLLHVPHLNVPVFYRGKMVVTIHDMTISEQKGQGMTTRNLFLYQIKHFGYGRVLARAVKSSKLIIVPTQVVKNRLLASFDVPVSKVKVIYEAADAVFAQKISAEEIKLILEKYHLQSPFLLTVGNAYPYKNIETLIASLKYLDPEIKLFMPSPQNKFLERVRQQAQDLGLENRIILPGYVADNDLAALYQAAACYVFPSLAEGFGLPGLEAMSAGLPVVCSDIEVFREVYGDAPLYFDPLDSADLAARIKIIMTEKEIKQKYIATGYAQVKKYSWERYAREVLDVYHQALKT